MWLVIYTLDTLFPRCYILYVDTYGKHVYVVVVFLNMQQWLFLDIDNFFFFFNSLISLKDALWPWLIMWLQEFCAIPRHKNLDNVRNHVNSQKSGNLLTEPYWHKLWSVYMYQYNIMRSLEMQVLSFKRTELQSELLTKNFTLST